MDFQVVLKENVLHLFMSNHGCEFKYLFNLTKDNAREIKNLLLNKNVLYLNIDFMFVFNIEEENSSLTFVAYPTEDEREKIKLQFLILENLLTSYIENLDEHIEGNVIMPSISLYNITTKAKNYLNRYANFLERLDFKEIANLKNTYLEKFNRNQLIEIRIAEILATIEDELCEIFKFNDDVSITLSMVKKFFESRE